MATISMSIGGLTSNFITSDSNAQRILEAVFESQQPPDLSDDGIPLQTIFTNQQKLNWIVKSIIPRMLVDKARQYEELVAVREAQQSVADNPPLMD